MKLSEDLKQCHESGDFGKARNQGKNDMCDQMTTKCVICKKEVDGYEPIYCCDGRECCCGGYPIEPCFCSIECENKVDT